MATLAALGPLVAPMMAHLGLPPALAVYAICAGCFIAILPNDSYYWLVRRDALEAALAALLGLWALGLVG